MLSSCTTQIKLDQNQSLLAKNKITLKKYKDEKNNSLDLINELSSLYKQKPNRNWLLIFDREKIYAYLDKNKEKKIRARKTLEKQAEPPAILDTGLIRLTRLNMYNYMFNKGFFDVSIESKIRTKKNHSTVQYTVNPGRQFSIDSLIYVVDDMEILNILNAHKNEAILTKGSYIDNFLFQTEKSRITELLNNHGYAEFAPVYIQSLDLDTLQRKNIVRLKINNPDKVNTHKKYTIGEINVFPDFNSLEKKTTQEEIIDGVKFHNTSSQFYIKNKIISDIIQLTPGSYYRKSSLDSTYSRISKLEFYKFINIESKIDTSLFNTLNHNIYLTPNYKWLLDRGIDFNSTFLKSSIANSTLLGVSAFFLVRNRNLWHSGAIFESKIEAGAELSNFFRQSQIINSTNINFSNSLQLPNFRDLTGTYKLIRKTSQLLGLKLPDPICKTSLNLGFEYVVLNNLFKYKSFNNNVSYKIPISKNQNINLSTINFSLYFPSVEPEFQKILDNNRFLENSFSPTRIFTSVFFNNFQYYSTKKINTSWTSTKLAFLEANGIEASILDGLSQLTLNKKITSKDGVLFSKFFKIEMDHRWEKRFPDRNNLIFRLNYGLAVPFLKSNPIPYIRQFFLGGPQSMRGWQLRELGPGANNQSATATNGNYFSSGDIKLEINAEYRFKIYWKFEGAIFTDIGNLWQMPNPAITITTGIFDVKEFYKQIAASSGLGLRLNFDYFLVRLDLGMKWRNPFPDEEGNYGIYTKNLITWDRIIENNAVHLALNYPF
ncbi:MAG: BamA/TamA family outer membrane protein [Saprospiraceae bacterium]|nr:BamA/TamA family outer membrane protein [Saprospiraceae bacterium]